jgi:hypothetical protein
MLEVVGNSFSLTTSEKVCFSGQPIDDATILLIEEPAMVVETLIRPDMHGLSMAMGLPRLYARSHRNMKFVRKQIILNDACQRVLSGDRDIDIGRAGPLRLSDNLVPSFGRIMNLPLPQDQTRDVMRTTCRPIAVPGMGLIGFSRV